MKGKTTETISQEDARKYKDFYDRAHIRHRKTVLKNKARVEATKELRCTNRDEYLKLCDRYYRELAEKEGLE